MAPGAATPTDGLLPPFIGGSPAMREIYARIRLMARSRAPVFITGESGTGKELCAQAIHSEGPRAKRPFVAINCGAIPKDLLESELFGHLKGSFTGAISDREGAARLADGGTLFLDEICELDRALQTKLLRFVQTGLVQPVGSSQTRRVDVRLVCATNRSPEAETRSGNFREDLYFRLHVLPLTMPPLRERDADVIEIARRLLGRFAAEEGRAFRRLSAASEQALLAYHWPGNVRELENAIRHAVVLHDGETLEPGMLPDAVSGLAPRQAVRHGRPSPRPAGLREIEQDAIVSALTACGGSIPRAARVLGVAPSTLYRKRITLPAE